MIVLYKVTQVFVICNNFICQISFIINYIIRIPAAVVPEQERTLQTPPHARLYKHISEAGFTGKSAMRR